MRIELLGTKLGITPAIRAYAEEKIGALGKFVKRFEGARELTAFVEVARATRHHRKGDVFYAEVTISLPGKTIRAEEYHDDLHAAIDLVKDALKVELERYKERVTAKPRGRGLRR